MRLFLLAALCCVGLSAQNLKFYYTTDLKTNNPSTSLGSSYAFPDTPASGSSTIAVNVLNGGTAPIEIITACVGPSLASCDPSPTADFTIDGGAIDKTLAPNSPVSNYPFYLHFTPTSTGAKQTYIHVFTREYPGQPVTILVTGNATAEQLRLTYNNGAGDVIFYPFRTTRLDFSTPVSQSKSITFTLTNETGSDLTTPAISIETGVYSQDSSPFAITTPPPATIPAGGTGQFVVTFSGSDVTKFTNLVIGTNKYGIQGQGLIVTTIDALELSYYDSTGVINRTPSSVTPISFPQLVPGTAGGSTLNFTLTNPLTSATAVTLSALSVSGSGFTLSSTSSLPVQIAPGNSTTFKVIFSAATSGTYTGKLNFNTVDGTRSYTLSGLAVVSPVPAMSLQFSQQVLTSGQQVTVTTQAGSASTQDAIGTLALQFTPAVSNVSDDPAVVFLPTSSRNLSLELAKGSQTATYQKQSAIGFQTGTTAGTLTFTLNFTNTPPVTRSFTITPALIHISTAQAQRQSPNLVITINGFDNTYSAGKMSFTFYDLKGKAITSAPLEVDATSQFHQLFFTNNQAGGAFAMQASFPVKGDVTQIGSVSVAMSNSAGQTTNTLTFQ